MKIYVGRQPIFNNQLQIVGYELSYRHGSGSSSATLYSGEDSTVCCVAMNVCNGFSLDEVSGGLPIYLKMTDNLLTEELPSLFKPDQFVFEVPPNLFLNKKLEDYLSLLYYKGYKLSLRSYAPSTAKLRDQKPLGMFETVRIDITQFNRLALQNAVKSAHNYHAKLLAENIDSKEKLQAAMALGFDLFIGDYLSGVETLSKTISLKAMPYGELFNYLLNGFDDRTVCYSIITKDPALTHMFLRKAFNCRHNRKTPLLEVERGLQKIRDADLRHWSAVLLLDQACTDSPKELVPDAFRRGLIMEYLSCEVDLGIEPSKAFMFGVASSLDGIMAENIPTVVIQLNLDDDMRETMRRNSAKNAYATLLSGAIACEVNPEAPALPSAFSKLRSGDIADIMWKCRVNTEYITLSLGYTVPTSVYKGNILTYDAAEAKEPVVPSKKWNAEKRIWE